MGRNRIEDKNEVIDLAISFLSKKSNYVILDTETTGLGNSDVIVQIGIIDLDGNVLLDTLIKPSKKKRIPSDATAIHGITINMLADSPTFKDIYPKFCEVVKNKTILIYNAKYDAKLIAQTALQDEIKLGNFNSLCIMVGYSMFVGEWSDYHKDYRLQKLPSGDHSAIGDCKATLKLIHKMANTEKTSLPKKGWW